MVRNYLRDSPITVSLILVLQMTSISTHANAPPVTSTMAPTALTKPPSWSLRPSTRPSLIQRLYTTLSASRYDRWWLGALLTGELLLGWLILRDVAYTEIDWIAYMQEVEGWLDGETDYLQIRGDTGPLVYPAGFLYLFAAIRWLTKGAIPSAQYMFLTFYLATQAVIFAIYQGRIDQLRPRLTGDVWRWRLAMAVLCCSKRLHSIYLLRLFNDGPTMLLAYLSIFLFARRHWDLGCVVFSLAVSIKMNVLLFAPGLLLLLLQASPNLETVVLRLGFGCALPQLILGWPFLSTYPISYLRKAFEIDRVFFYEWTVNYKFLDEEAFLSSSLAIVLLGMHLTTLGMLAHHWLLATKQQTGRRLFLQLPLSSDYIVSTLLVSNFVGVVFARTLHYQFYAWYVHALPYLLWRGRYPTLVALLILAAIESSFLTFPATPMSSAVLQICHLLILLQIRPPALVVEPNDKQS